MKFSSGFTIVLVLAFVWFAWQSNMFAVMHTWDGNTWAIMILTALISWTLRNEFGGL